MLTVQPTLTPAGRVNFIKSPEYNMLTSWLIDMTKLPVAPHVVVAGVKEVAPKAAGLMAGTSAVLVSSRSTPAAVKVLIDMFSTAFSCCVGVRTLVQVKTVSCRASDTAAPTITVTVQVPGLADELVTVTAVPPWVMEHWVLLPAAFNVQVFGKVNSILSPLTRALVRGRIVITTLPVAPAVAAAGTMDLVVPPKDATVIAVSAPAEVLSRMVPAAEAVWMTIVVAAVVTSAGFFTLLHVTTVLTAVLLTAAVNVITMVWALMAVVEPTLTLLCTTVQVVAEPEESTHPMGRIKLKVSVLLSPLVN